MSLSSTDLSHELAVMTDVFADLGERLTQAAGQLQEPGTPPAEPLVEELLSCRRDFGNLRGQVRVLAESLQIACPPEESLVGLHDLSALLDEIAEAEIQQARNEELRRRAVAVLEKVILLAHASDAGSPSLRACQEQARALNASISEASWIDMPAETEPLAEGEHPFAHLLTLVEDRDELNDESWASLHDSVGAAFGKSLAAAAVRSKLVLPEHAGVAAGD
jgi:hypothetical protein